MALPCNWTYEQTTEAFNRVKKAFEVENGRVDIIPEERYKEVFSFVGEQFMPSEPLCTAFGVKWHPDFENIVHNYLRQNISVMIVSEETNEIIGVRINGVTKKIDDNSYIQNVTYEPMRNLETFITQKDADIKFCDRYGVDEAMHFLVLGVHRNYRRLGLGAKLMGAGIALSRELGFKAIKGEGSSVFSQRIYKRYGFEVLCELPYDQYTINGQTLREKTGVHDMAKIVGLKL